LIETTRTEKHLFKKTRTEREKKGVLFFLWCEEVHELCDGNSREDLNNLQKEQFSQHILLLHI